MLDYIYYFICNLFISTFNSVIGLALQSYTEQLNDEFVYFFWNYFYLSYNYNANLPVVSK